ncbi:MAG: tetratricopeptide repeat protein [Blastocatellia bacterium]|nr:tetratricopeptide repeat protein [Blastocatellia bacterium]
MHNGPNGSVLLRHTTEALPTHLIVVNLDPRLHDAIEEMAAFLPAFGVTILHVHDGEDATVRISEINEAQMIRMMPDLSSIDLGDPYPWARATYRFHRPALTHALRTAFKSWADDRKQDRTVLLFAGAPRTPVEAALLGELPLDAQALFYRRCGALPLVLRFLIAPRRPPELEADLPLAHLLADLEQTYFTLPDYPEPFEPHADIDRPSASPFDTTVWIDGEDGTELVHLLRALLKMHGEENERLSANFPAERAAGRATKASPLDEALAADAHIRSIDWLAFCAPHFAPRLWSSGVPALAAVLDMDHEPRRKRDPYATIGRYERERNWDANLLVQTYLSQLDHPRPAYEDLMRSDFPYRLTDEDRPSKLEMARHLSDLGEFERAAAIGEELLEDDPHHRLLNRMLGADLYISGHRERGSEVLRHCIALTEIDPTLAEAERADEIATLYHLMRDEVAAISGYERALEADPLNSHAYEGLILIHRARGETGLADHWLQVAQRRELDLPLVTGDDRIEGSFEDEPTTEAKARGTGELAKSRERRSKWWNFLKR